MRSIVFAPKALDMGATRSSISLAARAALDAAVLGPPLLGQSRAAEDSMRETTTW